MKMIFKIGWTESFYRSDKRPELTSMSSLHPYSSSWSNSWNSDWCDNLAWSEGIAYSEELSGDAIGRCSGCSAWSDSELK